MSQVQGETAQSSTPDYSCSFCRKIYRESGPLVQGPDAGKDHVYICRNCAEFIVELFESQKGGREDEPEIIGPPNQT